MITPELALEGRAGGRAGVPARRPPPPRGDRQGHAAVRLHDRDRAGGGLHLGRHGRAAHRPDADAGRRHADALDARRSRRDDLGLAQPLRRQRHQAVRPGRLQAVRRDRARDRGADRRRHHQAARQVRRPRPRQAHRRRAGPLHRIRQAHAAAQPVARRPARGDRLRQRRRLSGRARRAVGARRRGRQRSASSRTASTSTRNAARPRPKRCAARCARCAPTSASRSTATPTGS